MYESILLVSFVLLICGDHSCRKCWPSNRQCISTRPKDDGIDFFLAGGPEAIGCLYKQFCLSIRSSICSGDKYCGGPQSSLFEEADGPDVSSELRPSGGSPCLPGDALFEGVEVHSDSFVWFEDVSLLDVSVP